MYYEKTAVDVADIMRVLLLLHEDWLLEQITDSTLGLLALQCPRLSKLVNSTIYCIGSKILLIIVVNLNSVS